MFEKSWQINTHGTRTRVRPSCLEAVKYDRIWTFQTPSDSRQILSSMCLLQLPESCHEACTPSVNLALAGLFKHPLRFPEKNLRSPSKAGRLTGALVPSALSRCSW